MKVKSGHYNGPEIRRATLKWPAVRKLDSTAAVDTV